jgi:tetratricopeptide (TPR) repeat protein
MFAVGKVQSRFGKKGLRRGRCFSPVVSLRQPEETNMTVSARVLSMMLVTACLLSLTVSSASAVMVDSSLLDVWVMSAGEKTVSIEFTPDARYVCTTSSSGGEKTVRGRYKADETYVVVTLDNGKKNTLKWKLEGDILTLTNVQEQASTLRRKTTPAPAQHQPPKYCLDGSNLSMAGAEYWTIKAFMEANWLAEDKKEPKAQITCMCANLMAMSGDYDSAAKFIQDIGDEGEPYKSMVAAAVVNGHVRAKDVPGALAALDQVNEKYRDDALRLIYAAQLETKNFAAAKETISRLSQPRDQADALLTVATEQARQGDSAGASETAGLVLAQVEKADPKGEDAPVTAMAAGAMAIRGDLAEAQTRLDSIVSIRDREFAHVQVFGALMDIGRKGQAGEILERGFNLARKIEPGTDRDLAVKDYVRPCERLGKEDTLKIVVGEIQDPFIRDYALYLLAESKFEKGDLEGLQKTIKLIDRDAKGDHNQKAKGYLLVAELLAGKGDCKGAEDALNEARARFETAKVFGGKQEELIDGYQSCFRTAVVIGLPSTGVKLMEDVAPKNHEARASLFLVAAAGLVEKEDKLAKKPPASPAETPSPSSVPAEASEDKPRQPAIVGIWGTTLGETRIECIYGPKGKYKCSQFRGNRAKRAYGTYELDGNKVIVNLEKGELSVLKWEVDGDTLILTDVNGNSNRMTRLSESK